MANSKLQTIAVEHFKRFCLLACDGIHFGEIVLPVATLDKDRLRRISGIRDRYFRLEDPGFVLLAVPLWRGIHQEHGYNPTPRSFADTALHNDRRVGVSPRLQWTEH